MEANELEQPKVSHRELLEKGITIFRKILNQPVLVTREEMCDLLNFEVAVNFLVTSMKATEGKTHEELMEMAKKAVNQD
jgi:hypothetical protein